MLSSIRKKKSFVYKAVNLPTGCIDVDTEVRGMLCPSLI